MRETPPLPPITRDPRQPADFDPAETGRLLLRGHRTAALATLDAADGMPIATLATYATDLDGAPLLLVSGLSHHTKNLAADPRCSLLISRGGKGDPLAHPRLTLIARAEVTVDPTARRRFLARHPKAKLYADFPDFRMLRLAPQRILINGGFARAFDGEAGYILSPLPDYAGFAALEDAAVEHMNTDHGDALDAMAHAIGGAQQDGWRCTGIDPHGLDLLLGDQTLRVPFPEPVLEPSPLRAMLMRCAREARTKIGQAN